MIILIIRKGSLNITTNEKSRSSSSFGQRNPSYKITKIWICETKPHMARIQNKSKWTSPNSEKCHAVAKLDIPKTLKHLRSFMGCIHHQIKITPHFASLSEPLCPQLSKSNLKPQTKLDWKPIHMEAFTKIKAIKSITKNKFIDVKCPTKVRCDASEKRLGACLQQFVDSMWRSIAYASRF